MNPSQLPEQPPVFPAQPSAQVPQPPLAKKTSRKKQVIIISSIIAAVLLIVGGILIAALGSRATEEDYTKAEALLVSVKAQNEASREAYGTLIFTVTNEMTKKPVASSDYDALNAYDRKKEVAAESDDLKTKTAALTQTVNELKQNHALKDFAVRAEANDFITTADAYIMSSNQLIESAPAMGLIITACLQPDVSLGGLLSDFFSNTQKVLQGVDNLTGSSSAEAYNPDTAVSKYDAQPDVKRCLTALAANDKKVSHPTLDATRQFMGKALDHGREQVVTYAAAYKSGGKAAGDKAYVTLQADNDTFFDEAKTKISADQKTYVEGLDIEARIDVLTPVLTKAKQAL